MARRLSKRQRLARDPANQPRHKFIAWARRHFRAVEAVAFSNVLAVRRIIWRKRHLP